MQVSEIGFYAWAKSVKNFEDKAISFFESISTFLFFFCQFHSQFNKISSSLKEVIASWDIPLVSPKSG